MKMMDDASGSRNPLFWRGTWPPVTNRNKYGDECKTLKV
jgi:hypothetical protein